MSDAKNINYHYMQQTKQEIKPEITAKKIDHANYASQMKNIFTSNKFTIPTKTNQLSSRTNEITEPKLPLNLLNPGQLKTNNFLTINNSKTSNFPKLNVNETRSNFINPNNMESSFKRNIRSQSKEINVFNPLK